MLDVGARISERGIHQTRGGVWIDVVPEEQRQVQVALPGPLDHALQEVDARMAAAPAGLAFYLAGADPHENDRLGRLKLSAEGLAERDRRVLLWLQQRRIPVALSMAGGYGRDLPVTVQIQARTLELACEAWQQWPGQTAQSARV